MIYKKTLRHVKKRRAFAVALKEYPRLAKDMLDDLLRVDGYSEIDVAFATGAPVDVIRRMTTGNLQYIHYQHFLSLLDFYVRVFCGWSHKTFREVYYY